MDIILLTIFIALIIIVPTIDIVIGNILKKSEQKRIDDIKKGAIKILKDDIKKALVDVHKKNTKNFKR